MRSILFFDKRSEPTVSEPTVRDLMLDKTVRCLRRGQEAEALFLRILQTPCRHALTVQDRQAVLQDLIANSGAIGQWLDRSRQITEKARERQSSRYRTASPSHSLDRSGGILAVQDDADRLLELLGQYAWTARFLGSLTLSSAPLCALRDQLVCTVGDKDYETLCRDMASLSVMSTRHTSYAVKAELSDDARQVTYRLLCVAERLRLHSTVEEPTRIKRLSHAEQLEGERLILTALRSLHDYLSEVIQLLTSDLEALHEELLFYEIGVRYYRLLTDKGAPIVWPTVGTDAVSRYDGLHDLYLTLHSTALPLPNNYTQGPLTVITGANSSGKTVFMRSIGTAQLFAQAGLPLPAEGATVCIKRTVLTVYAADEKETGRFEEECRLLSGIADTVTAEDLVLLNEPFQSTSYKEGGLLLGDILEVFGKAGIHTVLVTHLSDLKERLCRRNTHPPLCYTALQPYRFTAV